MDPICLGQCSLYMQTIFEKCPFKENGKLSKLFRLVLRGLNLPAGLIPHRTRPCWRIKPRRITFKNEYFCEFEKEFKNSLRCEFGDYRGSIRGKNQR